MTKQELTRDSIKEPDQKCTDANEACDKCRGYGVLRHNALSCDELFALAKKFSNKEYIGGQIICSKCGGKGK